MNQNLTEAKLKLSALLSTLSGDQKLELLNYMVKEIGINLTITIQKEVNAS
jgi:hypothetical protein